MSDDSSKRIATTRLFIAVDVPQDVKRALKRMTRHDVAGVRWSRGDQLHLTLHFLGDVDRSLVKDLINGLDKVRPERFDLTLERCGFFPNDRRPRVFWVGLQESVPLQELHGELQDVLDGLAFETERRTFKPHLTIARLNRGYRPRRFNDQLMEWAEPLTGRSFEVDAFHLYASELHESGATYTRLHTVDCR